MLKISSGRTRQAAAVVLLEVLSGLPYAIVFGLDRALGVPNAASSALWPTAVAPVIVTAVLAFRAVRARTGRQPKLATVQQRAWARPAHDRAA